MDSRFAPVAAALGAAILLGAACDPGDVTLLAPDHSGTTSQRVSIHAVVDTPFAPVAESLGWTAGVPGARVRLHRMEEPYDESYWTTALTDDTGVAVFDAPLSGLYEIAVSRALSPTETAQTGAGLSLVAGGRRGYLPTAGVVVTVAPASGRSLVFSEVSLSLPVPWDVDYSNYRGIRYFEVYNNGDTTIYLDGKYWGLPFLYTRDYPAWPCTRTEVVRNDPDGVWTRFVFRFPGRGTDHSLAPGEAALIANAAVDHRLVHPLLYDLSRADFEWGAPGTADNPDVPNLQDVGLEPMHEFWPLGEDPFFLSEPVGLETLPRWVDSHTGKPWVRIPRELVLDTWAQVVDWTTHNYEPSPACLGVLHRAFERLPGPGEALMDFYDALSMQRRVLTVLPDGRKVLQDTDTSMEDFVKAPRSPGWIPDSLP